MPSFKERMVKIDIPFYVFILVLLGKTAFSAGLELPYVGEDKSVVIGTSFFTSTDISIPGNFDIKYSSVFQNRGHLFFTNTIESKIILSAGDLGDGEFIFSGSNNCELSIPFEQARVGNLRMDMASGMVNLSGEFAILGKLVLNSGVIKVNPNSLLLIDNDSPDAVWFDDSPINKGYIRGFVTRKVSAGQKYLFPVGDAVNFHPMLIDKPIMNDEVSISFDATVPREIRSYLPTSENEIENSFGWRVKSNLAELNKFLIGLSISNTSIEAKGSQLEVYSFSNINLTGSAVASLVQGSYMEGKDYRSSGLYAFGQVLGVELVNFIYVADGNLTTFEIPDKDKYTNINLSVYNQLGNLIFESDHYSSEFDARNFPDGTYFYKLVLEGSDKRYTIRNFIEIRHEK